MNAYTPMQTLAKIHSQLWWNIRLVGSVEIQLGPESGSFPELVEVEKVLRATVAQLDVIIRREREKEPNSRNLRLARDFALKAQAAKKDALAPEAGERAAFRTSCK